MKHLRPFHLSAVAALCAAGPAHADAPPVEDVVSTYADIAQAVYTDALYEARELDTAIDALIDAPSEDALAAARLAWLDARVPYQQSEVFRFGNPIVDDWEGRVNAWPLDEGLIDYVDASYGTDSDDNEFYTANVVANETLDVGGRAIDASELTAELLADELQEAGGIESNVATGYHAIEFLLWGQDLNGAGPGAGTRPATDYDVENCTNGHCERRGEFLFSDNTATSHYLDGLGIRNVWEGRYERPDGATVEGPSLRELVAEEDPALAEELSGELDASVEALAAMVESQESGEAYDQLIAEGDEAGNALVQDAIDALIAQTRNIERVVAALELGGIEVEGSDSLDDPSAVFQ